MTFCGFSLSEVKRLNLDEMTDVYWNMYCRLNRMCPDDDGFFELLNAVGDLRGIGAFVHDTDL